MAIFKGIFGDENTAALKRARPIISAVNALEAEFQILSDADLYAKTAEFRRRLLQLLVVVDPAGARRASARPRLEDELPVELKPYAIVTQGVSIKTPLHRIASNAYNDMWRMLRKPDFADLEIS